MKMNELQKKMKRQKVKNESLTFSKLITPILFPEVLVEAADYCFSSLMFTSLVGVVTVLLIMSGTKI